MWIFGNQIHMRINPFTTWKCHIYKKNCSYNKNKWSLFGDYVHCFCLGIFHESAGWVKYPYQEQRTWTPQMITINLFLFLYCTTIDLILILMVYVYNFKDFTGETAISQLDVIIYNKRCSRQHHYAIVMPW